MMTHEEAIKGIIAYCKETIEDYQVRADLAVSKSWRGRIPIENADFILADQIADRIDEWCTDNDCPTLADDITIMDIIFNE